MTARKDAMVFTGVSVFAVLIGACGKQQPSSQATIEGKLCYHMVFGSFSEKGLTMGRPTYFIASGNETYLLSFDRECEFVNVDELRRQPGFERLMNGGSNTHSEEGSGPVLEVPGRVHARGVATEISRKIKTMATELTVRDKMFRVRYFEYIKRSHGRM